MTRGYRSLDAPDRTTESDNFSPVESVPPLNPRKLTLGLRALGAVFPGIRATKDQIIPYTEWWSVQNQGAVKGDGPLIVAIGDSISIGIGASHPSNSWVGQVARSLSERDGEKWRIVNLSIAGARIDDALERQLPLALELSPADLVMCCIGTNDIVWTPALASIRTGLRDLSETLPKNTIFGPVAGASPRARLSNRALRQAAQRHGQQVAEIWSTGGPRIRERMASDRFHPNDLGYELMASAVTDLLVD